MERIKINKTLIEDFLIQLEYLALKKEEQISSLQEENEDYKVYSSLLAVLKSNKIFFAVSFYKESLSNNSLQERLRKVIVNPESLKELESAIKNLYYISEHNLDKREEVTFQKETAFQSLDLLLDKIKGALARIDYLSNKQTINSLESYIEKIILLATSFEEQREVVDIDFFKEIIELIDLSPIEKRELISYALIINVNNYEDNKIAQYEDSTKNNLESDLQSQEDETLLAEMLNEKESREDVYARRANYSNNHIK